MSNDTMDKLQVRVYNVRFGDAILISVPDGTETRYILIDVGNSVATAGGVNTVFQNVVKDILAELAGRPLDLYIMTHEHMDHVQGLLYAAQTWYANDPLKDKLQVRYAWLTASSEPGYYQKPGHEKAKKQLAETRGFYEAASRYLDAAPDENTAWTRGLMGINNPSKTDDCVSYLRTLAPQNNWYVSRGIDPAGKHPFQEATFEIWAPEEDTSIYYGKFRPVTFGLAPGLTARAKPSLTPLTPPPGVDAGAFYDLVESRRRGLGDNLLSIDQAANNTSIVFCLNWRGWRLLFAADAQLRSWQEMNKRNLLKPVDFLKVGHHASSNATPPDELLNKILPLEDGPRYAVVSTYPEADSEPDQFVYNDVPDADTLARLKKHAQLQSTYGLADGGYVEYAFEPGGRSVTVTRV
jgi:hypothetical protein